MRGKKSPLRTKKPPTPPRSSVNDRSSPRREHTYTSGTSGEESLYLADDSANGHSPSFLCTDPASLSHKVNYRSHRSGSRSPLQSLRSSLSLRVTSASASRSSPLLSSSISSQGVSSATPRAVLDELSLRAEVEGREDKLMRVREWMCHVEAKEDVARFERGVRRFLEEEKERMASISSARSSARRPTE